MIAKLAVSAATFAIDKPYSYQIPDEMSLQPGQRVTVPFGRGNRRTEGVVLCVEAGNPPNLKTVEQCLDAEPVLTPYMLRMAAFVRERFRHKRSKKPVLRGESFNNGTVCNIIIYSRNRRRIPEIYFVLSGASLML